MKAIMGDILAFVVILFGVAFCFFVGGTIFVALLEDMESLSELFKRHWQSLKYLCKGGKMKTTNKINEAVTVNVTDYTPAELRHELVTLNSLVQKWRDGLDHEDFDRLYEHRLTPPKKAVSRKGTAGPKRVSKQ